MARHRQWFFVLAVGICVGTLFAAGATASISGNIGPAQTFTISGTVRDTGGVPIAGAQVIGFGSGSTAIGQSGVDGQYILTVSADTYDFQASKQGYFAGHVFGVVVPPSQSGVDLTLTPLAATSTALPTFTPTSGPAPTAAPAPTTTPRPLGREAYLAIISNPPTVTPTQIPTATPGGSAGIANGNFEQGRVAWTEFSDTSLPLITQEFPEGISPHNGSWAAWLGGILAPSGSDAITAIVQDITVPSDKTVIRYWHWIQSEEVCGAFDVAGIVVDYGAPDPDVVDAIDLCSSNNTNGWRARTLDMSKYKGQTVTFFVLTGTDSSFNSNWFVDDFAFESPAFVSDDAQPPRNDATTNLAPPRTSRRAVTHAQGAEAIRKLALGMRQQLR